MDYFDHNATAPLLPVAREAWLKVVDALWANPSSPSRMAARAHHRLAACRAAWAERFALDPAQVVFNAGATEGANAVFAHLARRSPPKARVLVSGIEHPCVREAAEAWFPDRCDVLPVAPDGIVRIEALAAAADPQRHVLVALMAANNETGACQPWAEAAAWCAERGLPILCDAAQWVGRMPPEGVVPVSFLIASGHKFGGPKGVGALLLGRDEAGFRGLVGGGQEQGHRAGTENLAGIAAMTAALEAQPPEGWPAAGRDALVDALPEGFEPLVEPARSLPHTLSLVLPGFAATRWIPRLEARGFVVSSGSACSTGSEAPSQVLAAMGLPPERARRVLRISGGMETTPARWRALGDALEAVRKELEDDAGSDRLTTVIEI